MSATTFLLILAAVVVVFLGFVIRSWSALSSVSRGRRRDRATEKDEDTDQSGPPGSSP